MNKKLIVNLLVVLFFLVSFILSINMNLNKPEEVCSIKTCDIVRNSQYSKIFGLELTLIGMFVFSIMIFLVILSYYSKKIFTLTKIFSFFILIFAFYLIYLQLFVIKAICDRCLIVDISSIIASLLLIFQNGGKNNFSRSRSKNKTNRK